MSKLTDIEQRIIVAMYEGNHGFYYPYSYFEAETNLGRDVLKPAMKHLRELKIMDFARGLMNEDGEVCGSGFGIGDYKLFKETYASVAAEYVTEHAYRKEAIAFVRDLGVDYYQRHQAAKKLMDFVAQHQGAIYRADAQVITAASTDPNTNTDVSRTLEQEQT